MTWQLWIVVSLFTLACIGAELRVGKEPKVYTADLAAASILFNLLMIALIVWGSS